MNKREMWLNYLDTRCKFSLKEKKV